MKNDQNEIYFWSFFCQNNISDFMMLVVFKTQIKYKFSYPSHKADSAIALRDDFLFSQNKIMIFLHPFFASSSW